MGGGLEGDVRGRIEMGRPVDLALALGPVRRGRGDLTCRIEGSTAMRATRTPEGPAAIHIRVADAGAGTVDARAWGPGAGWALAHLPDLLGAADDEAAAAFDPSAHRVVRECARPLGALRFPRTGAVVEALVPVIIEQKVTSVEAHTSQRALVRALGEPAPGPLGERAGLRLPPDPEVLARTPTWVFHRCGLERKRADAIRHACSVADSVERLSDLPPEEARRRLQSLPGVGPWTSSEVAQVAWADGDAVSVGDIHLPNLVSWSLAGEARGDDRRMLELLAPFAGHRGRVIRLLALSGGWAPRFGPRMPLRSIAAI